MFLLPICIIVFTESSDHRKPGHPFLFSYVKIIIKVLKTKKIYDNKKRLQLFS